MLQDLWHCTFAKYFHQVLTRYPCPSRFVFCRCYVQKFVLSLWFEYRQGKLCDVERQAVPISMLQLRNFPGEDNRHRWIGSDDCPKSDWSPFVVGCCSHPKRWVWKRDFAPGRIRIHSPWIGDPTMVQAENHPPTATHHRFLLKMECLDGRDCQAPISPPRDSENNAPLARDKALEFGHCRPWTGHSVVNLGRLCGAQHSTHTKWMLIELIHKPAGCTCGPHGRDPATPCFLAAENSSAALTRIEEVPSHHDGRWPCQQILEPSRDSASQTSLVIATCIERLRHHGIDSTI